MDELERLTAHEALVLAGLLRKVIGADGAVRYVVMGEFDWANEPATAPLLQLVAPR